MDNFSLIKIFLKYPGTLEIFEKMSNSKIENFGFIKEDDTVVWINRESFKKLINEIHTNFIISSF